MKKGQINFKKRVKICPFLWEFIKKIDFFDNFFGSCKALNHRRLFANRSVCLAKKCKKYYKIGVDTLRLKWYYKQVVSDKTTTNLEN